MAIATLAEVFRNAKVFTGVVKVRKGLACRMMLEATSLGPVHAWFHRFALSIKQRCPANDPSRDKIMTAIAAIEKITAPAYNEHRRRRGAVLATAVAALGAVAYAVSFS